VDGSPALSLALPPVAADPIAPVGRPFSADVWDGCAAETRRTYLSAWRCWLEHCAVAGLQPLPAFVDQVAEFCRTLERAGRKHATITKYVAAIAWVHAGFGLRFDTRAVKPVLRAIAQRIGTAKRGKAPLLTGDVMRLVATCDGETALGLRDRAVILLVYAGGVRRSEAVGLNLDDIEWRRDGAILTLRRSKTDQEGRGRIVPVRYGAKEASCPLRALKAWVQRLSASTLEAVTTGPVFRPIQGRHILARPLTGQMIWETVKRRCKAAGLDPELFGAHSLRSGHATQAAENGAELDQTSRQLGHKKLDTTAAYVRPTDSLRRSTSGKLGL
jgi:site-specific recombinase XerD